MRYFWFKLTLLFLLPVFAPAQSTELPFRIRTITAGVNLADLSDTRSLQEAIEFLQLARKTYREQGYEVQTIRVATQHFYEYLGEQGYAESLPFLEKIDAIAKEANVVIAIGEVLPPNATDPQILEWVEELVSRTANINFSLGIASRLQGIHRQSIKTAAAIIARLATIGEGGEANFRFAATATCPPGIPFFSGCLSPGAEGFCPGH